MPLDRTDLDAKLATQRQIISAAKAAAESWIVAHIRHRLIELEGLFPGHKFTLMPSLYGSGLKVAPPLLNRSNVDDIEGDFFTSRETPPATVALLLKAQNEIVDLVVMLEDEFGYTADIITTDDPPAETPDADAV